MLKKILKSILTVLVALVITCAAGVGIWYYQLPKFQDVTIELGTRSLGMQNFLTEYAFGFRASFITNVANIDISQPGATLITLQHGIKQETVTLLVQDTVAPKVNFRTELTETAGYIPSVSDFVLEVQDLTATTVTFDREPKPDEDLKDLKLTVSVTDTSGNVTRQECTVSYLWLKEQLIVPFGTPLKAEDLLLNPAYGLGLIPQETIDAINAAGVGVYQVESTNGQQTYICNVAIIDDQGPELELQELSIYEGTTATVEDFILRAEDAVGDVTIRFAAAPDFSKIGKQNILIEAIDSVGNKTVMETSLTIMKDTEPPAIRGLGALAVAKNSTVDYMAGVTAKDAVSGSCKVTYDASQVNLSKKGTYYVTYTATDKAGNTATVKRTIVVEHDANDTKALVEQIASRLSNDPEEIRDFVRVSIGYTSNWGGEDPVWYGFTKYVGNCYVHALCLKAIFDVKGIENQLIWVTGPSGMEKSHYWLLVKIDGNWKHIDPTPGTTHSVYSLMNDQQRYETLYVRASGIQRDWDRTMWPACP